MDDRKEAYFADLFERRSTAVGLEPFSVVFSDGTRPREAECHENVDRLLAEKPEYAVVRGWVIEADQGYACIFAAHSVVRSRSGALFDITLATSYPFLEHRRSEGLFQELRRSHAQQIWPLAPWPMLFPIGN